MWFGIAGSAGDMNAPQLIVENRAVTIEYARERQGDTRARFEENKSRPVRSDWLCAGVRTIYPLILCCLNYISHYL